jgi:predicted transposase YdaD
VAREEGRMEEKKETAVSLLKMGLSLDKISTVTGLSLSTIEKLAAMNNK